MIAHVRLLSLSTKKKSARSFTQKERDIFFVVNKYDNNTNEIYSTVVANWFGMLKYSGDQVLFSLFVHDNIL